MIEFQIIKFQPCLNVVMLKTSPVLRELTVIYISCWK